MRKRLLSARQTPRLRTYQERPMFDLTPVRRQIHTEYLAWGRDTASLPRSKDLGMNQFPCRTNAIECLVIYGST